MRADGAWRDTVKRIVNRPTCATAALTQQAPSVSFGPDLIVSTVVELVGMPALIIWLSALTRTRTAITAHQPA